VNKGNRVLIGFVAAGVVGGGGGFALGPIADSLAAHETRPKSNAMPAHGVKLEHVTGDVRLLAPEGTYAAARRGEEHGRPTSLQAVGVLSTFEAKIGATTLSGGHDARLLIGENDAALQLDRGQVKLSGTRVSTYVPSHRLRIAGTNYGVWATDDRVVVAVLDGEVEVTHGADTAKYSGGREIEYSGKSATPRALPPQLAIEVVDEQKGSDRKITANTSPGAFVFRKTDSGYEAVNVSSSGKFTVTLSGREPSPGELVAFDAGGRDAHLGGSPEAVKAALAPPPPAAPPPPPAAVEAAAPPPAAPPPAPAKKEKVAKKKAAKKKTKPAKEPPAEGEAAAPDEALPPAEERFVPEKGPEEIPSLIPINEDEEEKVD
jgi:hypothetical protein